MFLNLIFNWKIENAVKVQINEQFGINFLLRKG